MPTAPSSAADAVAMGAGWAGLAGHHRRPDTPLTSAAAVITTKTDGTAAEARAIAAEWAGRPEIRNAAALFRCKSTDELQA